MEQVIFISLLSGLATGIGGLIVIWFGNPTSKVLSFYLGISAGMMGMVVMTDLIPASLEYGGLQSTILGIIIGILIMLFTEKVLNLFFSSTPVIDERANHESFYRQLGVFMTIAIALHNIPEGLAIGAGFESQEQLGIRVALVIALHNIPEGMGVASTLFLGRVRPLYIFLLPLLTGFFIPLGTIIASIIGIILPGWIAIGLSIAGGAMGYLVLKDVGPESVRLHRLNGQFGMGMGILILYIVYYLK